MAKLINTVYTFKTLEDALKYCQTHPVIVDYDDDNYATYEVVTSDQMFSSKEEALDHGRQHAKLMGPSLLIGFEENSEQRWLRVSLATNVVSA